MKNSNSQFQVQTLALFCMPLVIFAALPLAQQYRKWTQARTATAELMKVIQYGGKVPFEVLIAQGADVNAENKYGYSVLHLASMNHPYAVEFLLKNGADVNAKNEWGETPIMLAAESGRLTSVKSLLRHGADVTFVTTFNPGVNHTALSKAREILKTPRQFRVNSSALPYSEIVKLLEAAQTTKHNR